jgi:hypothetical protein
MRSAGGYGSLFSRRSSIPAIETALTDFRHVPLLAELTQQFGEAANFGGDPFERALFAKDREVRERRGAAELIRRVAVAVVKGLLLLELAEKSDENILRSSASPQAGG